MLLWVYVNVSYVSYSFLVHSSQFQSLCSMKSSCKTLQNLPYYIYENPKLLFLFFISCYLIFSLMNARSMSTINLITQPKFLRSEYICNINLTFYNSYMQHYSNIPFIILYLYNLHITQYNGLFQYHKLTLKKNNFQICIILTKTNVVNLG